MTGIPGSATSAADGTAESGPLTGLARSEAADRLKDEVQQYLAAQATRMLVGVGRKLGETTVKLNDIADGNSPGFARLALDGGRKLAEGKSPMRTAVELGAGRLKDNVAGAVKNLGGKGGRKSGAGRKPTVVIESVDVGVPLRTAYDQWTRYQDFSTFAKGVKSADRADDTTSDWQLKVFWSHRGWKAKTTEQVPDDRIAWTSEGAKGTTKGVVSFHRLAENLTRVLVVVEYYPKGLFEKTGNIWRAQGRRLRLDLKNYVRFITLKGEAEGGWRGEIRDGEVVRSHEDAVQEEEREEQEAREAHEGRGERGEHGEHGEDRENRENRENREDGEHEEEAPYGDHEEDDAYEEEPEAGAEEEYSEDDCLEDSEEVEIPEEAEDAEETEDAEEAEYPAEEDGYEAEDQGDHGDQHAAYREDDEYAEHRSRR